MYLYRVLSKNDIALDPIKNGIFGKKMIDARINGIVTELINHDSKKFGYTLTKEELKKTREEYEKLVVSSYLDSLKKQAVINQRTYIEYTLLLKDFADGKKPLDEDELKMIDYILKIYKDARTHVYDGAHCDRDWISFSGDIEKSAKYYVGANKPYIAVIDSNIEKVINDGNLLVLDLSSHEKVEETNRALAKTNYLPCSSKFVGFNYAKSDAEIVYYSHIPADRIVYVLDQFAFDLIYNGMINEEKLYNCEHSTGTYCHINRVLEYEKEMAKSALLAKYGEMGAQIFDLSYISNYSVDTLVERNWDKDTILEIRREGLSYIKPIDQLELTSKSKEKILLPHDKNS